MMNWTTAQSAELATIAACLIAAASLFGLAITAFRNASIRKADLRQREFENYHKLIRDLVDGGGEVKREAQTAIIYELRNYPRYANVTARILISLKAHWDPMGESHHGIEIGLTLAFLERIKGSS